VISDYKEIKPSVRQSEERHEMMNEKIKWLENGYRKNNILIFRLEERRGERYFDTLEVAKKFLRETMTLEILNESIDYVARVGKRSGERPILMKLTSFSMKLEVFKKTKNLAGSTFRVDEDFAWETRKIRKRLIPYLKDAKRRGHRAFLKKDKLIVNGQAYDLEYLLGNIQLETGTGVLVTPANNRLEGMEEISQQNEGQAPYKVHVRETKLFGGLEIWRLRRIRDRRIRHIVLHVTRQTSHSPRGAVKKQEY
jgi:hypothetical protein